MTVLQIIWFVLVAVLWIGYLILEGFGIGAGMIMRMVAKNDKERTQVQKTYGPVWDGNEVWLLTAGGATFAAFPEWYATMFSGMYLALFLVLLCLIVRICAIEWRSKVASPVWRDRWDIGQTIAAWLVPVLLGVAFANLVKGMNIAVVDPREPGTPIPVAEGTTPDLSQYIHNFVGEGAPLNNVFLSLLTPFTILGGLAIAAVFLAQGALFLSIRTTGEVHTRSVALAKKLTIIDTLLVAVFAVWGQFAYATSALSWIPLVIAALAIIAAAAQAQLGKSLGAFLLHCVAILGAVVWVFLAMFPNVMKSDFGGKGWNQSYSLQIADAAASQATLTVMLVVAIILVPTVLGYTYWAYSRMPLRIGIDDVESNAGLPWDKIRAGASFLSA